MKNALIVLVIIWAVSAVSFHRGQESRDKVWRLAVHDEIVKQIEALEQ